MTYREAKKFYGKSVQHENEEYILLRVRERGKSDVPFVMKEFDAALYSKIRNAVRFVPLDEVKALPKELFGRKLKFGETRVGFPDGEQKTLDYIYEGVLE